MISNLNTIAVIGGGFSGLSIVYWLHQYGYKPTLITAHTPEMASSVPIGLMSFAGGQKGIPVWRYKDGMTATHTLLSDFQQCYPEETLIQEHGILRPAMQPFIEDYFRKNLHAFSEDEVIWLTPTEMHNFNPFVYNTYGGIWIPKGCVLSGATVCKAGIRYCYKNHISVIEDTVIEINPHLNTLLVRLNDSEIPFDTVIVATGSIFPKITKVDVSALAVPVKGQLMTLTRQVSEKPFAHGVSGQGYFGEINGVACFGSTYEHDFSTVKPTQTAENKLRKQLSELFPKWNDYYTITSQWTGVRVSTPDRMPMLGGFEEVPGLYFYFGNGSKGMIWSSFMGKLLAELLIEQKLLPREIDINRFKKRIRFNLT